MAVYQIRDRNAEGPVSDAALQTIALRLERLSCERESVSETLPERAQSWSPARVLETERRLKALRTDYAEIVDELWQMRVDEDVPTYVMAQAVATEDLSIVAEKLREFELLRTTPGGKPGAVSAALDALRILQRAEESAHRLLATETR